MKPEIHYNKVVLTSVIFLCLSFQSGFTQENNKESFFTPRRTMIAAAVLPGSGQIINGQWWKVPIFYAGFGACFYYFNYSRTEYINFRDAYILRTDNDPLTIDRYDPDFGTARYRYSQASQLKYYRDSYRRDLEFSLILTTGVYLLNIIDAYVGSHLKSFDLNEDLSISVIPQYHPSGFYSANVFLTYKF